MESPLFKEVLDTQQCYILLEPLESDLAKQVEYDMDEQGKAT